jgi:hypothetical protein
LEQDSSDPLKIVDDFLRQYDARAIEVRPKPASGKQVELGIKLSAMITQYRTSKLQYEYKDRDLSLKIQAAAGDKTKTADAFEQDYALLEELWRQKSHAALQLLACIDLVKGQGMVHDSASAIDELKKCKTQSTELPTQLHVAQQRIRDLEGFVRLLGGNPDNAGRAFTGDVEEP